MGAFAVVCVVIIILHLFATSFGGLIGEQPKDDPSEAWDVRVEKSGQATGDSRLLRDAAEAIDPDTDEEAEYEI